MKQPEILDCTLRDGGYHNNWEFSDSFISDYLYTLKRLNIDVIELGYRDVDPFNSKGRFANCTDDFIDRLNLPDNIQYAIMLDAKLIYKNKSPDLLQSILKEKSESKISIIRLAVNYKEVDLLIPVIRQVVDLGYRVFINLMQVTTQDLETLYSQCRKLEKLNLVETLYFADSFGRMTPLDISKVVSTMRRSWSHSIGFHGHNNKGLALMNTIEAVEEDVAWIDCTINGMGRGAGNVSTEAVLREYSSMSYADSDALFFLIRNHFEDLMAHYRWGPNLYYYIAAEKNIHPMYVQVLLKKYGNKKNEILGVLNDLCNDNVSGYDKTILESFSHHKEVTSV